MNDVGLIVVLQDRQIVSNQNTEIKNHQSEFSPHYEIICVE